MNNSLYALLFLLSGITAARACSYPPAADPVFATLNEAIDFYKNCSFCARNFSSSCVLSACPKLCGLCPYYATGLTNTSALAAITSVLSTCLQTQEVICGVTVGHKPLCPFTWNMGTLFPSLLGGSCALQAGTGFMDNLNNTVISVTGSDGPLTVSISAPNFTSSATYNCTFTSPILGPTATYNAPQYHSLLTFQLNALATVDLTTQPPTTQVKVQNSQITFSPTKFNGLPQVLKDAFVKAANPFFKASGADVAAASFVAAYVTSGLQAAVQSCPANVLNPYVIGA